RVAIAATLPLAWAQDQPETAAASDTPRGSVCIASVTPPAPGMKSLANPAGGNEVKVYTIKFDDLPPLRGFPDRSVEVPPLPLAGKHAVKVFGDGKQVASFYFRFSDYATNDLCLFFNELYVAWNLTDSEWP